MYLALLDDIIIAWHFVGNSIMDSDEEFFRSVGTSSFGVGAGVGMRTGLRCDRTLQLARTLIIVFVWIPPGCLRANLNRLPN